MFFGSIKIKDTVCSPQLKWSRLCEPDENVLLHFDSGICTKISAIQPRMLQIHLLCVRMLEVSFRTACPSFTEIHKTLRQHYCLLQSLNQDEVVRYMCSGCRIMVQTSLILSSELKIIAASCRLVPDFNKIFLHCASRFLYYFNMSHHSRTQIWTI